MFQPPILITGAGRSGASMIAGVLNICGAFGGEIEGSNRHFENIKIRDRIIVPYLKSIGADTEGQFPLPYTNKLSIPTDWASCIIEIMKEDGYRGGPWMVKGSRICLTWPIWHYAFPNAKWLIVRRRTGDIISSCIKTDFMRAFKQGENRKAILANTEAEGWKWWVHQYEQRFVAMINDGINCQVIWPERMVRGDYQQMFDVVDWLGLKWKTEALNYIDPKFYKIRNKMLISPKPLPIIGDIKAEA